MDIREFIDPNTVDVLEGLVPGVSMDDYREVVSKMKPKEIFSQITDEDVRRKLQSNICSIDCIIPSLHLVFEMLKHLEPAAMVLKQLSGTDVDRKTTIRQALFDSYKRPARPPVEMGRQFYVEGQWQSDEHVDWFLYTHLWARCSRVFWGMTPFTPRKEKGGLTLKSREGNPALFSILGDLAVQSGFRTNTALKSINRLLSYSTALCASMPETMASEPSSFHCVKTAVEDRVWGCLTPNTRARSCTHWFISPKASVSRPCSFQVNARLFMLVSVEGCSKPSTLFLVSITCTSSSYTAVSAAVFGGF
jgi:hypothetical protein